MSDAQLLTEAIWADNVDVVVALIADGIDVNASHEPHWPPLFQAIEHQRTKIARRLIAAGSDINRDVGDGWTPWSTRSTSRATLHSRPTTRQDMSPRN